MELSQDEIVTVGIMQERLNNMRAGFEKQKAKEFSLLDRVQKNWSANMKFYERKNERNCMTKFKISKPYGSKWSQIFTESRKSKFKSRVLHGCLEND
eukprot:UN06742